MWLPRLDDRTGPLYQGIADALAEDLAAGRLPEGARLPTHRELAERLGVTVGTVSRAYAEASRRGLLSGEVGRGTFVRSSAEPDAGSHAGFLDLGVNVPALPADDPVRAALQETLAQLAARPDLGRLMAYPPDGGLPTHREAGAAWIERSGLEADPEHVLVCSGSQHAVTILLQTLLQPGDVLLAEELTYPGLKSVAALLRLRLQGLPLDREGLRPEAFEDACRAGSRVLYTVPTIQNPTTSVMPAGRRREIARIARAYGAWVIEDDIHALLPDERPRPIAAEAGERCFYLSSTSKSLAPGLRTSYLLAPAEHVDRLAAAARATTWGSAPLLAEVAARWIREGRADQILLGRRREAQARQALAREALAGVRFDAHPCGYHCWLQLPDPWRSESFAAEARRRGVGVAPAEAFVAGRGSAPHAVRLSLGAARTRAELASALATLAGLLGAPTDAGLAIV
jgi:DNA-binding transcriptional MocR family regulator